MVNHLHWFRDLFVSSAVSVLLCDLNKFSMRMRSYTVPLARVFGITLFDYPSLLYCTTSSLAASIAAGASALLECLAFKATKHRDTLRVMKEVELLGANIAANGSREQMSYTIDCLRSQMPAALELLCDCVINPAFLDHELEEQKVRLAFLLANPEVQLTILTEVGESG